MRLRLAFGLLAAATLSGCTGVAGPFGYGSPTYTGYPPPSSAAPAGGPAPGNRVGLLVPLSGANASLGQAMVNAARLALDAPGAPALDALDTGGSAAGAAGAARKALADGDRMVLGPVTSPDVAAASAVTLPAGVPMLAFTSDPARAQPGVWVLGITPAQQVRRLVAAAQQDGRTRFAALLPETEFGHALADALAGALGEAGLAPARVRFHGASFQAMSNAMRDLSDSAARRATLDQQVAAARARGDAQAADTLARQGPPPPPFDALLVGAYGSGAREFASLLSYNDVTLPQVRVLGPGLWANNVTQLGGLAGAWYAAPDPAARTGFEQAYVARFHAPPPRLADLSFDAASIARVLGQSGAGFTPQALTNPEGFAGVDGLLALQPDGRARRGLALFEINPGGGARIVQPAPQTLSAPGV